MGDQAIVGVFFFFFALVCLFPILKPDAATRFTAQYFKWSMSWLEYLHAVRLRCGLSRHRADFEVKSLVISGRSCFSP